MAHQGQNSLAPKKRHTENFMFSDCKKAFQVTQSAARNWKVRGHAGSRCAGSQHSEGLAAHPEGLNLRSPNQGPVRPAPPPNAAPSARPAVSLQSVCRRHPPLIPWTPTVMGS